MKAVLIKGARWDRYGAGLKTDQDGNLITSDGRLYKTVHRQRAGAHERFLEILKIPSDQLTKPKPEPAQKPVASKGICFGRCRASKYTGAQVSGDDAASSKLVHRAELDTSQD